jgi:hypothetical protein
MRCNMAQVYHPGSSGQYPLTGRIGKGLLVKPCPECGSRNLRGGCAWGSAGYARSKVDG